jgi:CheY-like chemotaxis protein
MREMLERSLRGDVHVAFDLADDLWRVEVDAGELELVLLNLAVNARDAMPHGGTMTIAAQNWTGEPANLPLADYVSLTVTDTGTGMSPDVMARVFDPFYTTKDIGRGSGLGLAQVHGFATQSGGGVQVQSEVGQGTSVTLYLPRTHKAAPEDRRQLVRERVPPPKPLSGSVLLVEDDDEVAELVSQMLDQLGYHVTRAATASAALGALANGRKVDIVFSDIMMPGGMSGLDLAREIRSRRGDLPVLLTSGVAEAAARQAEAQGVRILPKPYRLEELSAALARTVASSPPLRAS